MMLDDFADKTKTLVLDDELIIDILLMQVYLTPYTDIKDFKWINTGIFKSEYIECKLILDYFEAKENNYVTRDLIVTLQNESENLDSNYTKVTSNIRSIAFQYMAVKLSELDEIADINDLTDNSKIDSTEIDDSLNIDDKIYIIKQKETVCPHDSYKLTKNSIARKVYSTRQDMRNDIKFEYKIIDILYCDKCNSYYVNQELLDKIWTCVNSVDTKRLTSYAAASCAA